MSNSHEATKHKKLGPAGAEPPCAKGHGRPGLEGIAPPRQILCVSEDTDFRGEKLLPPWDAASHLLQLPVKCAERRAEVLVTAEALCFQRHIMTYLHNRNLSIGGDAPSVLCYDYTVQSSVMFALMAFCIQSSGCWTERRTWGAYKNPKVQK